MKVGISNEENRILKTEDRTEGEIDREREREGEIEYKQDWDKESRKKGTNRKEVEKIYRLSVILPTREFKIKKTIKRQ